MKLNRTIKTLGLMLAAVCFSLSASHAQLGKVKGKVTNGDENLAGAQVVLFGESSAPKGAIADGDGKFEIAKVDPGSYNVEVTYMVAGKMTKREFKVKVGPGETKHSNLDMGVEIATTVIRPDEELFTVDPLDPFTLTGPELGKQPLPRGDATQYAALGDGVTQADHGDPLNMRGGRSGATVTFMDGQKVQGNSEMPLAAIAQVSVINGGIPAEFGDVTGGIVVITTRNPGMKGFSGKRLTRAERKALREKRKREKDGNSIHSPEFQLFSYAAPAGDEFLSSKF